MVAAVELLNVVVRKLKEYFQRSVDKLGVAADEDGVEAIPCVITVPVTCAMRLLPRPGG